MAIILIQYGYSKPIWIFLIRQLVDWVEKGFGMLWALSHCASLPQMQTENTNPWKSQSSCSMLADFGSPESFLLGTTKFTTV